MSQRLSKRQREALAWLPTVGKAGPKVCKRHGFALSTMHSLADRLLIERSYTGRGMDSVPIFRPRDPS